MEAIEECDKVVILAWEAPSVRHLKFDLIGYRRLLGRLPGMPDGGFVVVKPIKAALRVRFGHDDGRSAVSAADISHSCPEFESGVHACQRRNPGCDKVSRVTRPEEALGADE
jgi:hypothetical protein